LSAQCSIVCHSGSLSEILHALDSHSYCFSEPSETSSTLDFGNISSGLRTGQPSGTILFLRRMLGGVPNGATHSGARPTVFGTTSLVLRFVILHLTTRWTATRTATIPVVYVPYTHVGPDTSDFNTGCPPVGVPTLSQKHCKAVLHDRRGGRLECSHLLPRSTTRR
jgi:hypothetical protein